MLPMLETKPEALLELTNPHTDCSKSKDCIRVEGAVDEGTSDEELHFYTNYLMHLLIRLHNAEHIYTKHRYHIPPRSWKRDPSRGHPALWCASFRVKRHITVIFLTRYSDSLGFFFGR